MAALLPVPRHPYSRFQDKIALFPVTCKISEAAFGKLKELDCFRLNVGMNLGTERGVRLLCVDDSFLLRLSCYKFPLFDNYEKRVIEHVAPALCRGFDEECQRLVLRVSRELSLNNERTVLCDSELQVEDLRNMNATLTCSNKEIPFTPLPIKQGGDRDTLELHIDFKGDQWDLKSQFLEKHPGAWW